MEKKWNNDDKWNNKWKRRKWNENPSEKVRHGNLKKTQELVQGEGKQHSKEQKKMNDCDFVALTSIFLIRRIPVNWGRTVLEFQYNYLQRVILALFIRRKYYKILLFGSRGTGV